MDADRTPDEGGGTGGDPDPARDAAGRDAAGRDVGAGRDAAGRDVDTARDAAGRDAAGRDAGGPGGPVDPEAAEPLSGPSRRSLLLGVLGGTIGGTTLGTAALRWGGGGGLGGILPSGGGSNRPVTVHGGDDIDGARANALRVWEATPATHREGLRATYTPVGTRSTEQIDRVKNLLTRGVTDLVVVDPQFLPELVGTGQVRRFRGASAESLRDLGCFPGLVGQCEIEGTLHAVPLNADAPMLVANLSLLSEDDQRRVERLKRLTDPRAFWTEARWIASRALAGSRTVVLQSGDYEGLTVCLVELLDAFGGDVAADPGLATARNLAALRALRETFPAETFTLPADGRGDEEATAEGVQQNAAAIARLWPAQCHGLTTGAPADEGSAGRYELVPVPGGVLGGQVLAVAAEAPNAGAAQDLANHLSQPMSQLQLFHAAGYVPTLRQLHADAQVNNELRQLGSRLERASLRPALRAYTQWSEHFRDVVRNYLLGGTDDLRAGVTRPLAEHSRTGG